MTDGIERPCVTGSRALRAAARAHAAALGWEFSPFVDELIREDLQTAELPIPPPLPLAPNHAERTPAKPGEMPEGPDATVPWSISGSALLFEAARARAAALGTTLSGDLDGLVRAELEEAGVPVPPPLPLRQNGRRRQRP